MQWLQLTAPAARMPAAPDRVSFAFTFKAGAKFVANYRTTPVLIARTPPFTESPSGMREMPLQPSVVFLSPPPHGPHCVESDPTPSRRDGVGASARPPTPNTDSEPSARDPVTRQLHLEGEVAHITCRGVIPGLVGSTDCGESVWVRP